MERRLVPNKVGGVKPRSLRFRFYPQGTSTTPLTSVAGTLRDPGGFIDNVTRTGTAGVFTVTLRDPAFRIVGGSGVAQVVANNVGMNVEFGTMTEGSASPATAVVRLMVATTATDLAANTNHSVLCTLDIEDSGAAGVA